MVQLQFSSPIGIDLTNTTDLPLGKVNPTFRFLVGSLRDAMKSSTGSIEVVDAGTAAVPGSRRLLSQSASAEVSLKTLLGSCSRKPHTTRQIVAVADLAELYVAK